MEGVDLVAAAVDDFLSEAPCITCGRLVTHPQKVIPRTKECRGVCGYCMLDGSVR